MVEIYVQGPFCPYCNAVIINAVERSFGLNRIGFMCPKCMKVLSVGRPYP